MVAKKRKRSKRRGMRLKVSLTARLNKVVLSDASPSKKTAAIRKIMREFKEKARKN
jgi:hypothetical protein